MCDTERRCDRPSCPCNEPDTELKDALTRMQERFPAPWKVGVEYDDFTQNCWAHAGRENGVGISVDGYSRTPHAAVDAAIAAWDAAVKADALFKVLKAECEAWRAWQAKYHRSLSGEPVDCLDEWESLVSARAATDKAGALR